MALKKVSPIELQKGLKGTSYPADKDALMKSAKGNKASSDVMNVLEALPDQEYSTPADVMGAVGDIDYENDGSSSSSNGSSSKVNPIELQKGLKGTDYPADKAALMKSAKGNKASSDIMDVLEMLPDQTYDTPADVMKAVGEVQ